MEEILNPITFSTCSQAVIGEIAHHQAFIANTLALIGFRTEEVACLAIGKVGLIRGYYPSVKSFLQGHSAHPEGCPHHPRAEKAMLLTGSKLRYRQPLFVVEYSPEELLYPLSARLPEIASDSVDPPNLEYIQKPIANEKDLAQLLFNPDHTSVVIATSNGERVWLSVYMTSFKGGRSFGNEEKTLADYPELVGWIEASKDMDHFYKALKDVHNS